MTGIGDSVAQLKEEFPGIRGRTYLNTAAEGLFMRSHALAYKEYANLKESGSPGREGMLRVEQDTRELVASLLGVESRNIAFLASTARGLDAAIKSVDWQAGDNIVTLDTEFPTTTFAAVNLERLGVERRIVASRKGRIELLDIAQHLDSRTRLIVASLVSYKTGQKLDIRQLSRLAQTAGALLFIDAIQALGVVQVEAKYSDFLCAGTYKWQLGQHGLAVFYVNPNLPTNLVPPYVAFRSVVDLFASDRFDRIDLLPDARRYEEGMPNYPALFVLNRALRFLQSVGIGNIDQHTSALSAGLLAGLADLEIRPLTPSRADERAAIVSFETKKAIEITAKLAIDRVHVWGRDGRVRVSTHLYNSTDDVEVFLERLRPLVAGSDKCR